MLFVMERILIFGQQYNIEICRLPTLCCDIDLRKIIAAESNLNDTLITPNNIRKT